MLHVPNVNPCTNRKPWLAASLSWLLPGVGQIYSAGFGRGIHLIALAVFLNVLCIASLVSTRTSFILSLLLSLCGGLGLRVYASIHAFKLTRRRNTENFEEERALHKDPWLAVFLSVVLPGLGHIYVRRRIVGTLFLLSFLLLRVMSTSNLHAVFAVIVLPIIASAHAYGAWPLSKVRPLVLFLVLLLCSGLFIRILMPLAVGQFFVDVYVPLVGPSMEPTILDGSRAVVDRLTYRFTDPSIGDVILFSPSESESVSSDYIRPTGKRIVAAGGETVQIRDGDVYVDGKKRELRGGDYGHARSRSSPPIDLSGTYNPYLRYGVHEPYYVPENHYFVLGDNHRHSVDSRCFGAIPRENITGKVIKISWPPRRMGVLK